MPKKEKKSTSIGPILPGVRATKEIYHDPEGWHIYTYFYSDLGYYDFSRVVKREAGFKLRVTEVWTLPMLEIKIVPRQLWIHYKGEQTDNMPWNPDPRLNQRLKDLSIRTIAVFENYLEKNGVVDLD